MARKKLRNLPDLSDTVRPGAEYTVRATPKAAAEGLWVEEDRIRISVTAPPDGGRANKAVREVLAAALKVAPTRLTLVRGQTARDKLFRYDGDGRN